MVALLNNSLCVSAMKAPGSQSEPCAPVPNPTGPPTAARAIPWKRRHGSA